LQTSESAVLQVFNVNEYIVPDFIGADESESPIVSPQLYGAITHGNVSLVFGSGAAEAAIAARYAAA
jgi:hypothetical protein